MFQIGDRRMLISYLGLLSDLLGKAPKEGQGVVRSTSPQICSDVDPTTPSAPSKEASRHFIDGAATPPLPRRGILLHILCVQTDIGAPVLRVGNRQSQ